MFLRGSMLFRTLSFCLVLMFCAPAFAQDSKIQPASNPSDPDRIRALELYRQHKMDDAVPTLQIVVDRYPQDPVIREALGVALLSKSSTESDRKQSKADVLRSRAELLKAQSLGDHSDLLNTLLALVPESGETGDYSPQTSVNEAMRRGEAAFAKGDWNAALREYAAAYELDPKLYLAALDMGDTYFRLNQTDKAGEWFARAIEIEPNVETAYRYWGDALMHARQNAEARSKFLQGLAASPYAPTSWNGIKGWLQVNRLAFHPIRVQIPSSVSPNPKGGVNINLDPTALGRDDTGFVWIAYAGQRALWRSETFAKEFPAEKAYRHTLKEEVSALSMAVDLYNEQKKSKKIKHPNADLELLSRLQAVHMLEPYILFIVPDKELAQDFPSYQAQHRDTLISFLDKYLVPPAPDPANTLTNLK